MATSKEFTVDGNTIALWHMNGDLASAAKLDNAEGTSSRDLIEFNTPTNATGFNGESDGGYALNGTNESLQTATSTIYDYDRTNNITVEIWFNYAGLPGSNKTLFSHFEGGTQQYLAFANGNNLNILAQSADLDVPIVVDTLYYLALTMADDNSVIAYLNGVEIDTGTATADNSGGTAFRIGTNTATNFAEMNLVDECRISNVVRTAQEISDYYNDVGGDDAVFFGANF